jgi:hypothetical protein
MVICCSAVLLGPRDNAAPQQCSAKEIENYSFWEKARCDPVAYFTAWLVGFTGVLAASTIGLWIVTWQGAKRQSREMRDSIGIAERAARGSHRSADIAERALVAGQRAFVSVAFGQNANRNIGTREISHWRFAPTWLNTGNSPTRNMENHVSMWWPDTELADDWCFPDYWYPGPRTPTLIGIAPKSTIEGQSITVPVGIIADVIEERKFLYFWGWATYNDVFPETPRYVTRFAVRVVIGGDARNSESISFYYARLGQYNCSDEECDRQGFPASWQPADRDV